MEQQYEKTEYDELLDRVRNMPISERTYQSTGDAQLDLAFMLVRVEVDFLLAYTKSDGAEKSLRKVRSQLTEYQQSFYNHDIPTGHIEMADELVMAVYCIIKQYGLTLESIWHTDIEYTKLSKSIIRHGDSPKTKTAIITAVKYIDNAISDIIKVQANTLDIYTESFYEAHECDGVTYYEAKPCNSVFASDYAVSIKNGQKIDILLTEDIEIEEAMNTLFTSAGLTELERTAIRLYFVHGLSLSSCGRNFGCNGKVPPARIRKYIASGLDKIIGHIGIDKCDFTWDNLIRIINDGICHNMASPAYMHRN